MCCLMGLWVWLSMSQAGLQTCLAQEFMKVQKVDLGYLVPLLYDASNTSHVAHLGTTRSIFGDAEQPVVERHDNKNKCLRTTP